MSNKPANRVIDVGVKLEVAEWQGDKHPFVLVHGLASNKETWRFVAEYLAAAGHYVLTIDQRGHGQSEKPNGSYSFDTVTDDLRKLIDIAGIQRPIIAGQSWGGNVMLAFGSRFPHVASGLVFVDGGYFDLYARVGSDWGRVEKDLGPPELDGMPAGTLRQMMRERHPDWSEEGIDAQMANFHIEKDSTLTKHLSLENHMKILRAMWEQRPAELYPLIKDPVLLVVAHDQEQPDYQIEKGQLVRAAEEGIEMVEAHWFKADHDIHVQKPSILASLMLNWAKRHVF